jgi:hypothetical protein
MAEALPAVAAHGAFRLPSVEVVSYNLDLQDNEGFIGDRASKGAFRDMIERIRKSVRKASDDPLGDEPSEELTKAEFDELLHDGEPEAAGIVQSAIEDFAQQFAGVIRRFLKLKDWKDTQRNGVGGGFRASRVGELIIGRTTVILKGEEIDVELAPIHNDPDEAGLIGAVHLAPAWVFQGFDAVLAVDVGGTNIRAGVVQLNLRKAATSPKPRYGNFRCGGTATKRASSANTQSLGSAKCSRVWSRPRRRSGSSWRHSSASAVRGLSKRTDRSIAAPRTCRATGKARASIYR